MLDMSQELHFVQCRVVQKNVDGGVELLGKESVSDPGLEAEQHFMIKLIQEQEEEEGIECWLSIQ